MSEEFHIDAQDGSCEQMGRLLCTLYTDVMKKSDFTGLHRMLRQQTDVSRRLLEARRLGQAESERHALLVKQQEEDASDMDEDGEDGEEEDGGEGGAAAALAGLGLSGASASAAAAEPVEEKTAEQLQDEADGWETVPKKGGGGKKGGKK